MGTKYTYDGTTTTSGAKIEVSTTLTGSTIAYYGYVENDPYLRVYSATKGGTFDNITIGSGGTMYTNGGGTYHDLVMSGNSTNTKLVLYGNPKVSGFTVKGGAVISAYGVKFYDVNISGAADNRVQLYDNNYSAGISRGSIEYATVGMSRGTIREVTIGVSTYVNVHGSGYNSGGTLDEGGRVLSCTVTDGGQVRLWSMGDYVSSTTFTSNARLYMYGFTTADSQHYGKVKDIILESKAGFENGAISGTKNCSGGTATNIDIRTSSWMVVRNAGYASHVVASGKDARAIVSGGGLIEDVTLTGSGAYVNVHSGGVLNGVTIGSGCYVSVMARSGGELGGTATDVTVQSGGSLILAETVWQALSRNALASRVTIESGGAVRVPNYARLMDVTAGSGAVISRFSNVCGIGGKNTNIAKGVFTNAPGADFEVADGVATNLELIGNATTPQSCFWLYSGITATDAKVTSGGSLYLAGASAVGVDLYGSATKVAQLWVSNAGASNVRMSSGGYLFISAGAKVQNVTMTSGGLIFMSGNGNTTVTGLSMTSGATATLSNGTVTGLAMTSGGAVTVRGGVTVNGLSMACSGAVTMSGGTVSGLVLSGGTLSTVSNTEKKYIYNIDITKSVTMGVLNISSGTYISGGSIYSSGQLNIRQATAEDICYGTNSWINIYTGGVISGGTATKNADLRLASGYTGAGVRGTLLIDNAKVHVRDYRATVKNVVLNGANTQIDVSAGVVSSATIWKGNLTISGGLTISGAAIVSDTLIRSTGKIYQSGGSMINTSIYAGGSMLYIYDDFDNDGQTVVSNLTLVGVGVEGDDVSSGCAWGSMYGGKIDGGEIRRTIFVQRGGTVENVNFGEKTWLNASTGVVSNCGASNGGILRAIGAEFIGVTLTDSGTIFDQSQGAATDVTILAGASMRMSGGATVTSASVANGAAIRVNAGATANSVSVASGGTMYLSGTAKINELNAAAGAYIALDITGKTAGVGNFDSLANVNSLTIQNYNPGVGTYTLADVGNTSLKVGIVGSRVFDGEVAAGGNYVDPFISREFALNAAGTELTVAAYTRTSTGEAATFAQSGSVINSGDKALEWNTANVAGKVELLAASDTVAGNAWLDIRSAVSGAGAQIFGTGENVTFGGKISYQIHGTGGTIGNLAAGANYGGSVKGVDILAYGNTFAGVGYAGGFGTVGEDGVQVVFGNKDTLKKDFYGGALYNAAKVAAGTSTSVSTINMQFGESAGSVDLVISGNIYGGGAVKAGTITTTENTAALQTVGDITLTLLAGTATKGQQMCVFAGGYATGHDTAKEAPVYTVESVTLKVTGGDWGTAAGGRGIFGGAMANDNIGSDGVYAMVGDVNISISGGTMGNVFGGGWAQKKAFSRVGDVNITISGGTIANVFGGGSHSTSGGTTQAGDVTITVSGGTISGNIFARGQLDGDVVNSAEVIFTGANNFACGVYGYSRVSQTVTYVEEEPASVALSFTDYTGTFSGAIGGFDGGITVGGNTWMTLGTAADDVSNSAWIFDFNERDLGLDGQAALNWSTADFTDDTITLRIATKRSEGWTLVSGADASKYNTAADKFLVEIDGGEAVALTFDAATGKTGAIAEGGYAGWGFAVEDSVLKFKNLA